MVIASLYIYFVFLLGQLWSSPGPRAAPLFRADSVDVFERLCHRYALNEKAWGDAVQWPVKVSFILKWCSVTLVVDCSGGALNRGQTLEHAQCTCTRSRPGKFPARNFNWNHCRDRRPAKYRWTIVRNTLKLSEILQSEGFCFHS